MLIPFSIELEEIKLIGPCQCYKIIYRENFLLFQTIIRVEIACKCKTGKQIICCKISEDLLDLIKNCFKNPIMVLKYCKRYKTNCDRIFPTLTLPIIF